ncbi:MAG: nucleotidyltransferase family protein [Bacillota bacterium]
MNREKQLTCLAKKKINEIIAVIVQKIHPQQIYLFGSYAKGLATERSDLDLLIRAS